MTNFVELELYNSVNCLDSERWYQTININHIIRIKACSHKKTVIYLSGFEFFSKIPYDDFIKTLKAKTTPLYKAINES